MKIIKYTLSILAMVLAFASCTKDESMNVVYNPSDAQSGVLATPAAIVLTDETKGNDLPAFTWTNSSFGFDVAVNYVIEIALDEVAHAQYGNPFELDKMVRELTVDKNK